MWVAEPPTSPSNSPVTTFRVIVPEAKPLNGRSLSFAFPIAVIGTKRAIANSNATAATAFRVIPSGPPSSIPAASDSPAPHLACPMLPSPTYGWGVTSLLRDQVVASVPIRRGPCRFERMKGRLGVHHFLE